LQPYYLKVPFNIIRNGEVVPIDDAKKLTPNEKETYAILPALLGSDGDSKNPLAIVASIALMVVTMGVGNFVQYGVWSAAGTAGMAGWGAGAWVAAMGVNILGGMLISNLFGVSEQDDLKNTYSWGNIPLMTQEGAAIQWTFGEVRVGEQGQAQVLSSYVSYDGDKQYLNILLSGGEGPCDYIGDGEDDNCIGITNIRINGNPIENYEDVQVYKRAGLNDESVIPNFNDTYSTQSLSYALTMGADWTSHQTDGAGEALEVVLSLPYGIGYTNKKGRLEEAKVIVEIRHKKVNETNWTYAEANYNIRASNEYDIEYNEEWIRVDVDCTDILKPGDVITVFTVFGLRYQRTVTSVSPRSIKISGIYPQNIKKIEFRSQRFVIRGAQYEPLYRVYRFDNLEMAQRDVQVRCVHKDGGEDNRSYNNKIYWIALSHIIYDDFVYPNKIKLAIKALATDQLNGGLQSITWDQKVSNVWVWVPNSLANPDGPGSYQPKPANNPAWVGYAIYHRVRRLKNIHTGEWEFVVRGVPAKYMIYQDFANWAKFCEDNGIYCSYYIDESQSIEEATKHIETLGRGHILRTGTKIGCWFDGPVDDVSQIFTVATMGADGLTGEFIPKKDRANAIEVSCFDRNRGSKKITFPVVARDYIPSTSPNPTPVFLRACNSYEVGYKWAQYQLRINRDINETVEFPVIAQALSARPGKVIGLQYPYWGPGGRIRDVGDDWILVDDITNAFGEVDKVTLGNYGYVVKITLANDSIIERTVAKESILTIFGMCDESKEEKVNVIKFTTPFEEDTDIAKYLDTTHFTIARDGIAQYSAGKQIVLYYGIDEFKVVTVLSSVYSNGITTVEIDGEVPPDLKESRFAFTKPDINDIYVLGRIGDEVRKFRLLSLSMKDDLTAQLRCIEYQDSVYDESGETPVIDIIPIVPEVKVLVSSHIDLGGTVWVDVSWIPPRQYYGARILLDNRLIANIDMSKVNHSFFVEKIGLYNITVETLDFFGNRYAIGSTTFEVKLNPPPPQVEMLSSKQTVKGFTIYL